MAQQADFSGITEVGTQVGKGIPTSSNLSNQVGVSWNKVGTIPTAKAIETSIKFNIVGEVGKKYI